LAGFAERASLTGTDGFVDLDAALLKASRDGNMR
jgi:hypothetical protein